MSFYDKVGKSWRREFAQTEISLPALSEISLDQPNQRVIRYDCERTRSNMEIFRNDKVRKSMEALLTYYCQAEKIKYKQGMNEVLAPFVYLKLIDVIPEWSTVYTIFKRFIDKFLTFNFADEEFEYLQKSCVCFRTLLRYHAPSLASKLDNAGILPELYVTPWFLTLFAAKLKLPVLFDFWDKFVQKSDRTFFAFVGVSVMLGSVDELETSEKIELPEKLTKLNFNEESLARVWRRAEVVKSHTPLDMVSLLSNADRIELVPQLPQKIVPMYVGVSEMFCETDENRRFVVLDTRPQQLVEKNKTGIIPGNASIQFDLEDVTKGHDKFPVCEVYRKIGNLLGVDVSESAPRWPLQMHICILSDVNRKLVKRDYSNMLFLCLSRYCNVPRVALIRGGYEAVHSFFGPRLLSHDSKTCCFCNTVLPEASGSDTSSDSD